MLDIARQRLREDIARGDSPAEVADKVELAGPMLGERQQSERDAVETITCTSPFRRRDARELSGRVRDRAGLGQRRFIVDLIGSDAVNEGPLTLMLLGLRNELQRRSCRLVVAAEDGVAQRLSTSLRLDDVIGAASSLEGAVDQVLAPARAAPTRCLDCGTGWHERKGGPLLLAGMACARCGGQLTDGACGRQRTE